METATEIVSSDKETTLTSGVAGTAALEVTELDGATETVDVDINSGEIDDEGIVVEATTLEVLVDLSLS